MRLSGDVLSALAEGRQAYLAIETRHGPHVTPELYAWSDDRLWLPAASTTLKARALRSGSCVAAAVLLPGRAIVLTGSVDVFDVRHPLRLVKQAKSLPGALVAGARFAVRNAHDLTAFAGDALTGKLGKRLPPTRVFFALRPERCALIVGDLIVEAQGWGPEMEAALGNVSPPPGGEPAVVALPGPIALPARWFEDQRRVHVSASALASLGPRTSTPIAIVTDAYNAPGPAAKSGRLLRGTAVRSDEAGYLDVVDADSVSWEGVNVR